MVLYSVKYVEPDGDADDFGRWIAEGDLLRLEVRDPDGGVIERLDFAPDAIGARELVAEVESWEEYEGSYQSMTGLPGRSVPSPFGA